MKHRKTTFLTSLLFCIFIGACSNPQIDENDPASLFKEAEEEIQSDHYLIALEKLRALKNKFPQSKYATDAQLKIADVYYLQGAYPEAAASYESFRDLHPNHEKTPYAMFRIGKSYFNDLPSTTARDLTPGQKALESYQAFIHLYPNAPEVPEAKGDINHLRSLLAEKEFSIGEFYFKREIYDSCKPRFKKVIELYPETAWAEKAKEKLSIAEKKTK